ncbi:type VII secretion target [Nocardia carnea]|uniref:type VII secretion target n=1 Tax=Nocardia carnea TaxID=37328 RepID=UPI00245658F9|nr:type VII secretion target [Nocardia carnea]
MSDELYIALNTMLHAANKCDEAADNLDKASGRTSDVEIGRENAGTFALTIEKYATVPEYVRSRVNEGATVMRDIAVVLRQVRDTYEAEDAAFGQALGNQGADL